MPTDVNVAIISAAAALIGSISGGLISFLTTRHLRLLEWKKERLLKDIQTREELYSAFLSEVARLLLTSYDKKEGSIGAFTALYALLIKIQLIASPEVIAEAIKLKSAAMRFHSTESGDESEAKGTFTNACRREIDALRIQV